MTALPLLAEAIGLIAGAFTTIAFLPQVLRTWRTRSAQDLSFAMLAIFASGLFLWLVYGLMILSLPVILANVVTLALVLVIIGLKLGWLFPEPKNSEKPPVSPDAA
jgi:MtN3 and saliva related transmembrane protein